MTNSLRTPYDGVVIAAPVTIPYVRYSIESAQWWIGRALSALVAQAGIKASDVDGMCVSSFTMGTDSGVGLTQHFGLCVRWLDTIPLAQGYIPAPPAARVEAWDIRLGPRTRFRVGIVWAGNPDHKNDHNRSMTLRTLAPLLDCDVQFVSLQKNLRGQDRAFLEAHPDVIDQTRHLTDFSETAALMSCLDLAISVDTSVAHLAGALGIPVWTMVPFNPDWRWLLNRCDSPWYQSMRLFRQAKRGDWSSVGDHVRVELEHMVSAWQAKQQQFRYTNRSCVR